MPFWQEWALLEGLNEYNEALSEGEGKPQTAAPEPQAGGIQPYYPKSTDKMATPEELISLGVQYSQV